MAMREHSTNHNDRRMPTQEGNRGMSDYKDYLARQVMVACRPSRPSRAGPMHEEYADHLAEKLTDLRRGGEVASRPERLTDAIVAVLRISKAEGEIVGNADRSIGPDQRLDLVGERIRHDKR